MKLSIHGGDDINWNNLRINGNIDHLRHFEDELLESVANLLPVAVTVFGVVVRITTSTEVPSRLSVRCPSRNSNHGRTPEATNVFPSAKRSQSNCLNSANLFNIVFSSLTEIVLRFPPGLRIAEEIREGDGRVASGYRHSRQVAEVHAANILL